MKTATAILAAIAAIACGPAYATLDCSILVDGAPVGACVTSNTGTVSFSGSDAPLFSSITLTGTGSPDLPQPDLSSVTLDVSSADTFTGTHTLDVRLFQTNVSAPAGTTLGTTATINTLIGEAGPTTLSAFENGTSSSLGSVLQSQSFPVGTTGTGGPLFNTLPTDLFADAHEFQITFTAGDQSVNDTLQTLGVSPPSISEPSGLALLGGALAAFGWVRRRRSALA